MGAISLKITYRVTVDKDTGLYVYYNKKYNISGYGHTPKQAKEMLKACVVSALEFKPKHKK